MPELPDIAAYPAAEARAILADQLILCGDSRPRLSVERSSTCQHRQVAKSCHAVAI
jgi:hypothetical protein